MLSRRRSSACWFVSSSVCQFVSSSVRRFIGSPICLLVYMSFVSSSAVYMTFVGLSAVYVRGFISLGSFIGVLFNLHVRIHWKASGCRF